MDQNRLRFLLPAALAALLYLPVLAIGVASSAAAQGSCNWRGRARRLSLLGTVLAVCIISSAGAATINYAALDGLNTITVAGTITDGDAERFEEVAAAITGQALVVLSSPGGLVKDGLIIGIAIRRHGYATGVPDSAVCSSICGLMWLAGEPRYISPSSKVGFHAAFRVDDGRESGQANALIGAYLSKLGLSYDAIAYMTDAPPDEMRWLTPVDAEKYHITYSLIRPSRAEPQPFMPEATPYRAPAQTPQPVAPPSSSAEQQANRLVQAYYAYWSQGGANVESLAQYYAEMVSFYGNMIPRERVMNEKRNFSTRWQVRHYTINSIYAQCDVDGTCSVTGVVAWDCTSQERGEHSVGTANFAVRLVNGRIVSENGSVLTGRKETAELQTAASTGAYAEGRQARIAYETWYNGLPEGSYKEGVTYWISHRSLKPPPNCVGDTADGLAGCNAARARFAPIDYRRLSDKNYWFGWNSL